MLNPKAALLHRPIMSNVGMVFREGLSESAGILGVSDPGATRQFIIEGWVLCEPVRTESSSHRPI